MNLPGARLLRRLLLALAHCPDDPYADLDC